mmetsp:Transcript_21188/g.24391  ORF Transcript_21188/g.24391 Transcript_21188/m.24391 type:complete len:104 (+) Transcript_21188:328-639(+)
MLQKYEVVINRGRRQLKRYHNVKQIQNAITILTIWSSRPLFERIASTSLLTPGMLPAIETILPPIPTRLLRCCRKSECTAPAWFNTEKAALMLPSMWDRSLRR